MDQTERILRLIASLLDAREPVSREEIRSWFPEDYGAVSDAAFERKFSRDKQILVELGLPLRYVDRSDGAGYVIDRRDVFLPEIDFDVDELAALVIAGRGMVRRPEFPYRDDLEAALEKLSMVAADDRRRAAREAAKRVLLNHPAHAPVADLSSRLELAADAVERGRRLWVVYCALYTGEVAERTIDPYALRCWRGRWAVIGYCHLRGEVRQFSLHRMRALSLADPDAEPPEFSVPPEFSLEKWQMQPAWRFRVHPAIRTRVEVRADRAWLAEQALGTPVGPARDGWAAVDLDVTNTDGLVEWALRQGPNVRVVSPASVRDRVVAALRAAAGRGGAAA